jgi:hypothetical protein
VDIFAKEGNDGAEDVPAAAKPRPGGELWKLVSFRSWGGSLGRRVRSLRKRLSREGRELGVNGVEGVVGDCGGALIDSEYKGSSSNSTFGTGGLLVNDDGRVVFTLTCLLVRCIYRPPGFAPERLEIEMGMKFIYQYLPQCLNN